jgi:hypothetical protein
MRNTAHTHVYMYIRTYTCMHVCMRTLHFTTGGTCASNQPPPGMQNGASARANGRRGRERPTPGRHFFTDII